MDSSKNKKARVKKKERKYCLDFIKEINFINLTSQTGTNGEKFTWMQIQKFKFEKSFQL